MAEIHILHENDAWTAPLLARLDELALPYRTWFVDRGSRDLAAAPPEGIFYNRMSASSHTRGHRYAAEYSAALIAWLESHGRRVINGGRALQLEISKVAQYAALGAHGIATPRTVAAVGREAVVAAASRLEPPFITKHNRAGRGLGVRLFRSFDALAAYVEGPDFQRPVDGITLLQEYIEAGEPAITRCEFVGGRFLYAVRVDTSAGFELCPADACADTCPSGAQARFQVLDGFDHPLLARYAAFLQANDIEVAGIGFIVDRGGRVYTYDANTNYNAPAEAEAGVSGMRALARYLGQKLAAWYAPRRRATG